MGHKNFTKEFFDNSSRIKEDISFAKNETEILNNLSRIENDITDIKDETVILNNLLEQLKNDKDLIEMLNRM